METQEAAERLLSDTWGGGVALETGESLGGSDRSHVIRYQVAKAPGASPATVVVKHAIARGGDKYDPSAPEGPAARLFNDWAGLQFLTQCFEGADQPTPRFIAGDRAAGLIVQHDLGKGKGLDRYLLGDDPAAATAAVIALFKTMGRVHAATCGRQDEYDAIRQGLGPVAPDDLDKHYSWHREHQPKGLARIGLTPPDGLIEEMDDFVATLRGPGPFRVYSHNDPCPDNTMLIDGKMLLLDFEFSTMGNAAVDMCYTWALWPSCWCVNQLPEALKREAVAAYRAELVKGCPAAADDALFNKQLVAGCVDAALPRLNVPWLMWSIEKMAPLGNFADIQQILARLEGFAQISEELGYFPLTRETALAAATEIRSRLPKDFRELPLYPAFR